MRPLAARFIRAWKNRLLFISRAACASNSARSSISRYHSRGGEDEGKERGGGARAVRRPDERRRRSIVDVEAGACLVPLSVFLKASFEFGSRTVEVSLRWGVVQDRKLEFRGVVSSVSTR